MSESKSSKDIIYTYVPAEAAAIVIVCAPTNLIWNVQVGGLACRHLETEGWMFTLVRNGWDEDYFRKFVDNFNDCKWGCINRWTGMSEDDLKKHKLKYAEAIDNFLNEFRNGTLPEVNLNFDYERIEEVMEGWWPVLIRFYCDDTKKYSNAFKKGYFHLDNCD